MPANLTPQYKKAEELFRQAKSTEDKISALELMLSAIPKHKGTEHLQADIKRRLAKLREPSASRSSARHADIFYVPRGTAAGQVVLLGTPNCGKSALVAYLTHAHVQVADFPFSTAVPVPGIMPYEDIQIQLVDMPPITEEHIAPGQTGAYRNADMILVVADLSAEDVTEQLDICLNFLLERTLIRPADADENDELYKRMTRTCLWVATKADLAGPGDFETLQEMYRPRLEMMAVSINEPASLGRLARRIYELLRIVRVYSKLPGKKPDMDQPFTLPTGSTVQDLTCKIHRELTDKLRFARIWGPDKYAGQQVPRDYVLQDKDIIELHFS